MSHRHLARRRPPAPQFRLRSQHGARIDDPILTREGATSHPGRIVFAVAGLLFAAYLSNFGGTQVFLDGFFRDLEHTAHLRDAEVGRDVVLLLPWAGIALVAVVLFFTLLGMKNGAKTVRKVQRLRKRDVLTVHEFTSMAQEHGVGTKVSREMYRLLLPHYRNSLRARLTDSLTGDLQVTGLGVKDMYSNLLMMTDRQRNVGVDISKIDTILELMQAVEQCKDRSLSVSQADRRAAVVTPRLVRAAKDASFIRPARLPRGTGTEG